MDEISLITYKELLDKLKDDGDNNHLLLGNGFNNSLGINTSYPEIFSRMEKKYPDYKNVQEFINNSFDIEHLIGHLKKQVESDKSDFLRNYIERKIKMDFMVATNEIVQKNIKNVYKDQNKGIHSLLKNFLTYFTLNYDPFLYLLLLKFNKGKDKEGESVAFQNISLFREEDLNQKKNDIHKEIQELRENGEFSIISESTSPTKIALNTITKSNFESIVREYSKNRNKNWTSQEIINVCNHIWGKNNKPELHINDGFQNDFFQNDDQQNLYFIHGSFHIFKDGNAIKKITAKTEKSFTQNLEHEINHEEKEIVFILSAQSGEKEKQITNNKYLEKCFNALSKISGSLVILGSSLAKNDKHIFGQINKSNISKIYISSCEKEKEDCLQQANHLFQNREIILFDYTTISYKE